MRTAFLLIAFLISAFSNAQNAFEKQFKEILSDTATGFSRYRGDTTFKNRAGTLFEYESLNTVENTRKNRIISIAGTVLSTNGYVMRITDSVEQKEGEKICDEWKNRVATILDSSYLLRKQSFREITPSAYGWSFRKGELEIVIDVYPADTGNTSTVSMVIFYSVIY